MKKVLFSLLALAVLVFAYNPTKAQGDERKKIELKSADVTTRGANPNIKEDRPTTDDVKSSRGSGSGTCYVYLHNYTGYSIDIYVDGYWEGTLGKYDDAWVTTGSGYTSLYGVSVGRTKEWKFSGAYCYGSYDYYFY